MAALAAAAAIGVATASWQPSQPIRPAGTPAAAPANVAPAVSAIAARTPSARIEVIAQLETGAPAAALVATAGGELTQRLSLIGAVVARVSAAGALRLATEPGVQHVSLNAAVRGSTDSLIPVTAPAADDRVASAYAEAVAATESWSQRGATGRGVTVAVLDTGIAGDQPDFRDATGTSSRVVVSAVMNPDAQSAGDKLGHGTHIAGLVAGNGLKRNGGLQGRYLGVAPEANLVSVKISDDQGATTVADVINGLQFVVENKDALGIRIVNLSLNSTVAEPAATDPLDAAAEITWANGIVVVAAAGNRGGAADATHYAPANDPYVITVGAVDDQNTRRIEDDVVTDWSSRGPTQAGAAKPDVVAPGAHLVSVLAPGAAYADQCPSCVVDGAYLRLGGTSMAAGVASGAVALVLQRHPNWSPDQVKGALIYAARSVSGGGRAIDVVETIDEDGNRLANRGNTPSTLLPARAEFPTLVEWTRMSLSRMSLSRMSLSSVPPGDPLHAAWSRMSLSCACRPVAADPDAPMDPSRMSLSRMSLSRMSLSTSFTK
jgi:serine protease AprX